jgi:hypothetical protein
MSPFGNEIKQWLQTNDMPTQEQFATWVDRTRLKDEPIEFNDMEASFIELVNSFGTPILKFADPSNYPTVFNHTINAGFFVEWIQIVPLADCVVTLNDGYGNLTDIDVSALNGETIIVNYNALADRNISIEPIPVGTIIRVKKYNLP